MRTFPSIRAAVYHPERKRWIKLNSTLFKHSPVSTGRYSFVPPVPYKTHFDEYNNNFEDINLCFCVHYFTSVTKGATVTTKGNIFYNSYVDRERINFISPWCQWKKEWTSLNVEKTTYPTSYTGCLTMSLNWKFEATQTILEVKNCYRVCECGFRLLKIISIMWHFRKLLQISLPWTEHLVHFKIFQK